VDPERRRTRNSASGFSRADAVLPAEFKRDQVEEITQRTRIWSRTCTEIQGLLGRGDAAEQRELRAQRRAELSKILSRKELEEYDLRNSQVAQQMQWEMRSFDPNEAEFRAFTNGSAMDEKTRHVSIRGQEAQEKNNARARDGRAIEGGAR